jgi:hypothetical protein
VSVLVILTFSPGKSMFMQGWEPLF